MKIRTKEKDFADEVALEAMKILMNIYPDKKAKEICRSAVNMAYELLDELAQRRNSI